MISLKSKKVIKIICFSLTLSSKLLFISCSDNQKKLFQYIPSSTANIDEAQKIIEKGTDEIISLSTEYGSKSNKEFSTCIHQMTQKIRKEKVKEIKKLHGGRSGDNVFLVLTESNYKYVVKMIPTRRKNFFFLEATSLKYLSELKIEEIKNPTVLELGKCRLVSDMSYIVAETFMQGRPLFDYTENLLRAHNKEMEETSRKEASKVFYEFGKTMAKVHKSQNNSFYADNKSKMYFIVEDLFSNAIKKLNSIPNSNIPIKKFEQYLHHLLQKFNSLKLRTGFMHYDPNFGNYLAEWSEKDKKYNFNIIDTESAFKSFTYNFKQVGLPYFDIYQITKAYPELIFQVASTLAPHKSTKFKLDMKIVADGFRKGHQEIMPMELNDEQEEFYEAMLISNYIEWFFESFYFTKSLKELKSKEEKQRWIFVHYYREKILKRLGLEEK